MGLFKEGKVVRLLTDITGVEDRHGDMDFKVAGTKEGVTALQMDIKAKGLSHKTMVEALASAKQARLEILEEMLAVISAPREKLSDYAPKVATLTVPVDKIGEVIGPGGKMIKGIIEKTGTAVDVGDDGLVSITAVDESKVAEAKKIIEDLTREMVVGEVLEGEVKRITDFGAFVEILPGREGLVHISELAHEFVSKASDVVKEGEKIEVKVIGVDQEGKISLSKKALEKGSSQSGKRGGYEGSPRQGRGGNPGGNRGKRGHLGYRTPDWRKGRHPYRSPYGDRNPPRKKR
jgi:polyribonucleotide nucleotidyltransferase